MSNESDRRKLETLIKIDKEARRILKKNYLKFFWSKLNGSYNFKLTRLKVHLLLTKYLDTWGDNEK